MDYQSYINSQLQVIADHIKSELERISASGKTKNEVRVRDSQIVVGDSFWYAVEGRGSGKVNIKAIAEWCKVRNIPDKALWAIVKSIEKNGTERWRKGGLRIFEAVQFDKGMDNMTEGLANMVTKDAVNKINKQVDKINKITNKKK